MISLSFWCIVRRFYTVEVTQNVKFTCSKTHMKCFLEKISRGCGLQPELIKGEIEHSIFIESNFADLGHIWEPYLRLDVLCLDFI